MEQIVDSLPVKYKEKICRDFVKCSRLAECENVKRVVTKCFRWRDHDPYDFLKNLTCHLSKEEKIFLCDRTKDCSVKIKGGTREKSCSFADGKFCSAWFDHLSELDFVEKPKKVKIKKTDLDVMDRKMQDIADRWNISTGLLGC